MFLLFVAENKTPKLPTPAATRRRKSLRQSLAASSTSTSETEAEVSMSIKGRRKSRMTERSADSPRKSTRRSQAPENGAVENMEETTSTGAVEKVEDVGGMVDDEEMEKANPEISPESINCTPVQNTEHETCEKADHSVQSRRTPASCERVATVQKDIDNFTKTPVPLPRSTMKYRRSTSKTLAMLNSPEER
jgi:hypothetical protein